MREDLKKGFTGSVLFAAACVGKVEDEIVKKALETVADQDVKEWVEKNIGETFVQKRRKGLGRNRKKTGRKTGQKQVGTTLTQLSAA